MDDKCTQRLRAAVTAAWWTILIGVIWITVAWFAFLGIMAKRPEWAMTLWGGRDISWPAIQNIALWGFAVMKLILYFFVFIAIWLSLWYRKVRRI